MYTTCIHVVYYLPLNKDNFVALINTTMLAGEKDTLKDVHLCLHANLEDRV